MKRSNDYVVLLLDDAYIFRFTRGNELEDIEQLLREQAVLNRLRDEIRVPVPDFCFRPDSLDYVGYTLIPGTLLSPWRFRRLSRSRKRDAALEMPYRDHCEGNYERVAAHLDPELRGICERWLTDLPTDPLEESPAFVHSDIYPYHILHDPCEGRLTGIIDWADHCITDRAKDFSGLWFYGESFVDDVLSAYPHKELSLKTRSLNMFKALTICCIQGDSNADSLWKAAIRAIGKDG